MLWSRCVCVSFGKARANRISSGGIPITVALDLLWRRWQWLLSRLWQCCGNCVSANSYGKAGANRARVVAIGKGKSSIHRKTKGK